MATYLFHVERSQFNQNGATVITDHYFSYCNYALVQSVQSMTVRWISQSLTIVVAQIVSQSIAVYAAFSLILMGYQDFSYSKSIIKRIY
jgi:hypothetical protein